MIHVEPFDPNNNARMELRASRMNRLREKAISNQILPGVGTRTTSTAGGTIVSGIKRRPYTTLPPLLLVWRSSNKVGVTPGYCNGIMPTIGGTALDASPKPQLTITANCLVWLQIVGTFGSPDTYVVTVESGATVTPTSITGTEFTGTWLLGNVTLNDLGDAIVSPVYLGGNIQCDSFGNIVHVWKV